ncbi:MAG: NAD(P)-binding domain-containing protein [Bacteroidetes bacterium]|nr:NAD(P)-binding domain-containing protein [Bacteroidota bacterium]
MNSNKITFIGSGSIATALASSVSSKISDKIYLLSIEEEVIESINTIHRNNKYFPFIPLNHNIVATSDISVLKDSDIIFLALPSSIVLNYIQKNKDSINEKAILINLAKGFGDDRRTIIQGLEDITNNPLATLKGPSFARDIINNFHTGLTLGINDIDIAPSIKELFKGTNIHLDYSQDILGVELISILKNIYAIVMGIVDAHYNSPNLRFMVLTNAFQEMRGILKQFGGKEETLFNYCGFGDFGLTALNDLSRNRTMGLLIGKGFLTKDISDQVLLEGRIAVNVFCEEISKKHALDNFHIISELYNVFYKEQKVTTFVNSILNNN